MLHVRRSTLSLNPNSALGVRNRLQRTSVADSAASAASSGGDAVAHLPRTSMNRDSGSTALSRSSAGSAHGVKTFVDKVRRGSPRPCITPDLTPPLTLTSAYPMGPDPLGVTGNRTLHELPRPPSVCSNCCCRACGPAS